MTVSHGSDRGLQDAWRAHGPRVLAALVRRCGDLDAAEDAVQEALLAQLQESGEWVTAEALAAPSSSTIYRWGSEGPLATDGPYAESKEHLAGFFLVDCATRERAEEVAVQFAGPGDVVELRPAMWAGGGDA